MAYAAQLLFPLLLVAVVPHVALRGCPQTEAMQAWTDRYTWVVLAIQLGLVIAVAGSLVWWSAGRRRRWAWVGVGLAVLVLLAAVSLFVAGLEGLNLCHMLDI